MKHQIIAGGLLLGLALTASATVYNYDYTVNTTITDGSPVGITEAAVLSGMTGNGGNLVGNVDVRLNISGGFNGDLYGYLVLQSADGSTITSILLNRVGRTDAGGFGYTTAGMTVTLSGHMTQGYANIHDVGSPGAGPYLADGRAINPNGNFSGASTAAGLNMLNGINANGTWMLFLADMANGDQSTLVSWGLDITVVPEPATRALGAFGLVIGIYAASRRLRRQQLV
ncbi:MAG: hypothetical protein NTZ16_07115 [Verrucomicrobia bacterium]|nr:hypothetical protein [Verrucomicrobiota bacterium]